MKLKRSQQSAIQDRDAKRRKVEDEARARERERERQREREEKRKKEEEEEVPHRTLFVENLPDEAAGNPEMLAVLFQNFDGFGEVRIPPGTPPVAFIDFANALQAKEAKSGLQDFKITYDHSLKISYAKK
jgi:hypothetical protein